MTVLACSQPSIIPFRSDNLFYLFEHDCFKLFPVITHAACKKQDVNLWTSVPNAREFSTLSMLYNVNYQWKIQSLVASKEFNIYEESHQFGYYSKEFATYAMSLLLSALFHVKFWSFIDSYCTLRTFVHMSLKYGHITAEVVRFFLYGGVYWCWLFVHLYAN